MKVNVMPNLPVYNYACICLKVDCGWDDGENYLNINKKCKQLEILPADMNTDSHLLTSFLLTHLLFNHNS